MVIIIIIILNMNNMNNNNNHNNNINNNNNHNGINISSLNYNNNNNIYFRQIREVLNKIVTIYDNINNIRENNKLLILNVWRNNKNIFLKSVNHELLYILLQCFVGNCLIFVYKL